MGFWPLLGDEKIDSFMGQDVRWGKSRFTEICRAAHDSWSPQCVRWGYEGTRDTDTVQRIGGAVAAWAGRLASRATEKVVDPRGMDRFVGRTLKGNAGRTMAQISVYAPCRSGSKGGNWVVQAAALVGEVQTDPWFANIEDLQRVVVGLQRKGTVVMLMGDWNFNPSAPTTKRDAEWYRRALKWRWFLETTRLNIFSQVVGADGAPIHTIDSVLMDERWCTGVRCYVGQSLKGLVRSAHEPIIVDVPVLDILGLVAAEKSAVKAGDDRHKSTLRRTNKKDVELFQAAVERRMPADMVVELERLGELANTHVEGQPGQAVPPEVQESLHSWDAKLLALLQAADQEWTKTRPSVGGTRRKKDGWSQPMANASKALRKLFTLCRFAKRGRSESSMLRTIAQSRRNWPAVLTDRDICLPGWLGQSAVARGMWVAQVQATTREIISLLQASNRRLERQKMSTYGRKREADRDAGKLKRFINSVLKPQFRETPQSLTVSDEHGVETIYTAEADIKSKLVEHWDKWMGAGTPNLGTTIPTQAGMLWDRSIEGEMLRAKVARGTERDVDDVGAMMPPEFRQLLPYLAAKRLPDGSVAAPEMYGDIFREISVTEWSRYWAGKKGGKAPGFSGVTVEMVVCTPPVVFDMIRRFYSVAFKLGIPLRSWGFTILCPKSKVPGSSNVNDLRPLQLLEVLRKAVCGILRNRLMSTMNEFQMLDDTQHGFVEGHSTVDPTMLLVLAAEDAKIHHTSLHAVSLDIRRAYDSIERTVGKDMALRRLGVPEEVIVFLTRLDDMTLTTVVTPVGLSGGVSTDAHERAIPDGDWFWARRGWCQGAEEAPLGWTVFYDVLLTMLRHSRSTERGYRMHSENGDGVVLDTEAYADDTISYSSSHDGLQETMDIVSLFCSFMGLELAAVKCVYTCVEDGVPWSEMHPLQILDHFNRTISDITCMDPAVAFRYLGVFLAVGGDWSTQIDVLKGKVEEVCEVMAHSSISGIGADVIMRVVLQARVVYPLKFTAITAKEMRSVEWPARGLWLNKQGLPSNTAKDRMGMNVDDVGLSWLGWWNEAQIEKALMLVKAVQSPSKLGAIVRQRLHAGSHSHSALTGRTHYAQAATPSRGEWMDSALSWLESQGLTIALRDRQEVTPFPEVRVQQHRRDKPVVDRIFSYSDGSMVWELGHRAAAVGWLEGGSDPTLFSYDGDGVSREVGGFEEDQTVARAELLGVYWSVREGPLQRGDSHTQEVRLDRQGTTSIHERLLSASFSQMMELDNRDVWESVRHMTQLLGNRLVVDRTPGHPNENDRPNWTRHDHGNAISDMLAGEVKGKITNVRPHLLRGNEFRWELWSGDREVVQPMRKFLRTRIMTMNREKVCAKTSAHLTNVIFPQPPQNVVVARKATRSLRGAVTAVATAEMWSADLVMDDMCFDKARSVGHHRHRIQHFKMIHGMLPDEHLANLRTVQRHTLEADAGLNWDCSICNAPLVHRSNEHALLYCSEWEIRQARECWATVVMEWINAAGIPPDMRRSLTSIFALNEGIIPTRLSCCEPGEVTASHTWVSWEEVARHSSPYDLWRGVLHGGWWVKWSSALPLLDPEKIACQMAGLIVAIRSGWAAVWAAYTTCWKLRTVQVADEGSVERLDDWIKRRLADLLEHGTQPVERADMRNFTQSQKQGWVARRGVWVVPRSDSLLRLWHSSTQLLPRYIAWQELKVPTKLKQGCAKMQQPAKAVAEVWNARMERISGGMSSDHHPS